MLARTVLLLLLALAPGCAGPSEAPPVAPSPTADGVVYQDPGGDYSVWFPARPSPGTDSRGRPAVRCALDGAGSYLAVSRDPLQTASHEAAKSEPRLLLDPLRWSVMTPSAVQGLQCLDFAMKTAPHRQWERVVFSRPGVYYLEVVEAPGSKARDQFWTGFMTPMAQVDFWGHYFRRERERFWSSFSRGRR